MRPVFILLLIRLNWPSQFKFSSMIIPRYLAFSTLVSSEPLSSSVSGSSSFLVLSECPVIINSVFWRLGLLDESLLTLIHCAIFASSLRAPAVIFTTLFEVIVIGVLSA